MPYQFEQYLPPINSNASILQGYIDTLQLDGDNAELLDAIGEPMAKGKFGALNLTMKALYINGSKSEHYINYIEMLHILLSLYKKIAPHNAFPPVFNVKFRLEVLLHGMKDIAFDSSFGDFELIKTILEHTDIQKIPTDMIDTIIGYCLDHWSKEDDQKFAIILDILLRQKPELIMQPRVHTFTRRELNRGKNDENNRTIAAESLVALFVYARNAAAIQSCIRNMPKCDLEFSLKEQTFMRFNPRLEQISLKNYGDLTETKQFKNIQKGEKFIIFGFYEESENKDLDFCIKESQLKISSPLGIMYYGKMGKDIQKNRHDMMTYFFRNDFKENSNSLVSDGFIEVIKCGDWLVKDNQARKKLQPQKPNEKLTASEYCYLLIDQFDNRLRSLTLLKERADSACMELGTNWTFPKNDVADINLFLKNLWFISQIDCSKSDIAMLLDPTNFPSFLNEYRLTIQQNLYEKIFKDLDCGKMGFGFNFSRYSSGYEISKLLDIMVGFNINHPITLNFYEFAVHSQLYTGLQGSYAWKFFLMLLEKFTHFSQPHSAYIVELANKLLEEQSKNVFGTQPFFINQAIGIRDLWIQVMGDTFDSVKDYPPYKKLDLRISVYETRNNHQYKEALERLMEYSTLEESEFEKQAISRKIDELKNNILKTDLIQNQIKSITETGDTLLQKTQTSQAAQIIDEDSNKFSFESLNQKLNNITAYLTTVRQIKWDHVWEFMELESVSPLLINTILILLQDVTEEISQYKKNNPIASLAINENVQLLKVALENFLENENIKFRLNKPAYLENKNDLMQMKQALERLHFNAVEIKTLHLKHTFFGANSPIICTPLPDVIENGNIKLIEMDKLSVIPGRPLLPRSEDQSPDIGDHTSLFTL